MAIPETEHQGVCELCHELILKGQPHVRVVADATIWNGEANFESLTQNKVLVFSVFHSLCLEETMKDEGLEVPYIWEARSLLRRTTLNGDGRGSDALPEEEARLPGRLTLLQGGLR